MTQLTVIIEQTENNYAAYIEGIDGIVATGHSVDEIKTNMIEAIDLYVETCKEMDLEIPTELLGDYSLTFKMDTKSMLAFYYGIFTKAGLSRLTGINQKQLWHYASGASSPRPAQKVKIENALHKLGEELLSVRL
ncbi:MAG: type II toxin-antitoxin system HicB family antitoxin [Muribaculaceae bacterium]|nr:type II toxin-antitoxin system HicB family antitoxin [Muribaculaceae bacterium]